MVHLSDFASLVLSTYSGLRVVDSFPECLSNQLSSQCIGFVPCMMEAFYLTSHLLGSYMTEACYLTSHSIRIYMLEASSLTSHSIRFLNVHLYLP